MHQARKRLEDLGPHRRKTRLRTNGSRTNGGRTAPPAGIDPRCRTDAGRRRSARRAVRGALAGVLLAAPLLAAVAPARAESTISHAVAIRETPRFPADFAHYDHVDPGAPKGGTVRLASVGSTFDSLNPFIVKGDAAAGIGRLFDTLTADSPDEATASYGLVAEWIEIADDGSWTTFWLRPEARFHDGSPVTPADVAFSLEVLKSRGHPFYRGYYGNVIAAEPVEGETPSGPRRGVRFRFAEGTNQELPSILGQLDVLSKADWEGKDFSETTLEPPLGSGPYVVEEGSIDPGRSIVYRRNPDYWARDLAVNVGRHNFERIRYDYYRDATVAVEALKAGEYHFRAGEQLQALGDRLRGPRPGRGSAPAGASRAPAPGRNAVVRVQHQAREVPGSAGARGARTRVRLRVDERPPLLRAVPAKPQLLLQLRARFVRTAERGRARDSRAVPGPGPGPGVHRRLRAAPHRRRAGRTAAEPAPRPRPAARRGLGSP